jgi:hypothetical protein
MNEGQKSLESICGALGLSALALAFGACCVAPWAVALLGVSGAVLFARLAFLQPYLVAATAVLAALGVWHAYRRLPAAGERCPAEQRSKLRRLVWTVTLLVIAIDIASFAPRFLS